MQQGGLQPTLATALFLIAGQNVAARIDLLTLFDPDEKLSKVAGISLNAHEDSGILGIAFSNADQYSDGAVYWKGRKAIIFQ